MTNINDSKLHELFSLIFRAHPWHGVSAGAASPEMVTAFIEIVPTDTVKFELDKASGLLKIDRPQEFSSLCPMPYGFIPQTYCGEATADFAREKVGNMTVTQGDGDPLDICVLTEKNITHGNLLVQARPIGGLRMIDKNEADDKIIAVLNDDVTFGELTDISHCPKGLINRLLHYFLTYKLSPSDSSRRVEIPQVYGREEAFEVISRSQLDYRQKFGAPENRLIELKQLLQA